MARALRLAERGLYTTDPNPRVGALVVKDGVVVGEGFHHRAGEPHAEPLALSQAGEKARGATVYVSLEPCSHQGRTPPCADALIRAGVARVVAAMQDPNPLVAGRGLQRLREAGVSVECGLLEEQAQQLNPGFIKRMERGLPFVRCKMAMSLDGRTAMASGESQWITGPEARRDVQFFRARSSAILTGIGTVLADDPSLNVRLVAEELHDLGPDYPVRQPMRVVLDSGLAMPPGAKLLTLAGETMIFCNRLDETKAEPLRRAGALIESMGDDADRVDLEKSLRRLAELAINEVWVETGPTLAGALLAAGLVDELILYVAPHLMGDGARGLFHLPGLSRMADRIELDIIDARSLGRDLRLRARIKAS
ncbi:MAG: bifunctional diaminohydroxyphosphoribosylaminopyrimidine deaminase/5-amino-6-(5-phosphoribosylamino)uracil reductase RibD [Gammaproteobacteria bacterium]|nr:bifunctional diaminohydroxyphosphoribosylaminopyrimidine deaminase/5-amino-6-(5-phosphoribosylamino)uracil reductase RibD [Gammaproteobacteria bacterium]MBU1653546.1 bifunctional diaminohydroxyphosphoribosylaminopyrimidine deaminase/5-amino-6-(5-phosphoribosylamino)uracil reductase RibD [Gammaproteobacteria bacterium]MBU1961888.1 bifunctional diaminohydroxyphosphoribosylaminopyrimidine deaminase/5-amino-6-(5-phosphoribosylamino)uracil reductase RibD [Gammaproteobacteria bacterium]